jgi:sugar phosphate isomerase/epimerase
MSSVEPLPPSTRLSICEITTKYLTLEEDVHAYIAAGIDGISLWWDKVTTHGVKRARDLLEMSGLPAVSMVGVPFLLPPGSTATAQAYTGLLRAMDDCATMSVPVLGVVPGNRFGRSDQEMREGTVAILHALAEEASARHIALALEPIHSPYIDYLNSLRDAMEILSDVAHPNVKLLFDIWHLCHEADLYSKIDSVAAQAALVHFSDWRDPTRFHDDRLLPGCGVLPLRDILRRVDAAGYKGFYDVEIFSEDVWAADQNENLAHCRTFFDGVWKDEV